MKWSFLTVALLGMTVGRAVPASAGTARPTMVAQADVFTHPVSLAELQTILAEPNAALSKAAGLRGQFVQKKYLAELPKPLLSSGRFVFSKDHGLCWQTEKPFASEFVLSGEQMISRSGSSESRLSTQGQPALALVSRLFLALVRLDAQPLAEYFQLFAQAGSPWQLGLKARDAGVARAVQEGLLSGRTQVERVQITDGNGDRAEIIFSASEVLTTLSADERKLFP